MALVIPVDYAQCAFNFEYLEGGGTAVVTMGMDFRGYTGTRAGGIDAVAGAWQTNILPGQSTVIRFLGVTARWGVLNSEPVVVSATRAVVGANAGSMLTRNTALLVKKRTNRGGRRGRGRMYVPGRLAESAADQAGNILTASITSMQTDFTALDAALTAIGGGMVLLHDDQIITSYSSTTGKPVYTTIDPGPPDAVFELIVDGKAATQRRRMRG